MQRVDGADLAGHLQRSAQKFEYVVLPSVATSEEKWFLSNDKFWFRRQGQVLDKDADSPEQQYALWQQVGDFVYATQYLQCTVGTRNGPKELLREPRGDNWTPENWSRRGGFRHVTVEDRIAHYAFARPLPEHAHWVRETQFLSDDEWEMAAAVHTKRMDELRRDPTTGEKWMKPRSERQ